VAERIAALKGSTGRPLAVGFGLDDPASLERVRAMGAVPVVGSALVAALAQGVALGGFLGPRLPGLPDANPPGAEVGADVRA
jgi:tryptophan synthase alpha subunit